MAQEQLFEVHTRASRLDEMKTYAEILEVNTSIPPKLMEIRDQEVEIVGGAVHIPALSLIIPLNNVKYVQTGQKPAPKPAPAPTPRQK